MMTIYSCVLKCLRTFDFHLETGNFVRGFSEEMLSSALVCTVGKTQPAAAGTALQEGRQQQLSLAAGPSP